MSPPQYFRSDVFLDVDSSDHKKLYCCIFVLEKLKVKNMFLNVYFAARFILSSNSNNCCLLYFNATIICSFTKKA